MARNSGVFYYSEVADGTSTEEVKENKFHSIASFKSPKMKSTDSTKNIKELNFKAMNGTITAKHLNGTLNSSAPIPYKSSSDAIPVPSGPASAPGSPSRTRSISSPPTSSPELTMSVKALNILSPPSERDEANNMAPASKPANPYATPSSNGENTKTLPSYDSLVRIASKKDEAENFRRSGDSLDSPRESPRRYSMEDEYTRDSLELSPRGGEESPRKKEYQSENETSSSTSSSSHRDMSRRRTVRHMLSRMSSLPNKEAIRINREIDAQLAPASPQQTAPRPPKVLKRNPSFWEADTKKGKNQMTLRRIFASSTNTLLREPDTLFSTILEREEASIKAGKQIFLDRNPKYFGPILDYMRTGSFDRDAHIKYAKSIMVEAEFFKVKGLIKLLHEVPELSRVQLAQIINSSEKPKLRGLWLPTINLAGMDLTRVNLDFSQLAKSNLRNVLLGGASICNASFVEINLRNAILSHATLAHTDFTRANISNATLRFVKCMRCDFTEADLSYCVFEGADMQQCDFSGANLAGADFTSADLTNSVFRNAIFSEETTFGNTITKNVDYEGSNIDVTKRKGGVFAMLGKKKSSRG